MTTAASCASESTPEAETSAEVLPYPTETARPDEKILRIPATIDGDTSFSVIGLTAGMTTLIGSHAEWQAKGQFVRLRMVVTNVGRSSVLFDARKHLLIDDNHAQFAVDSQAMTIKRQPDKIDLGANVRMEYDLYFDIPTAAKPAILKVYGGPTLSDLNDNSSTDIILGTG